MSDLGIDPKWFNIIKRRPASVRRWRETHEAKNRAALEYYAAHGVCSQATHDPVPPVDPAFRPWEPSLPDELSLYAAFRLADLQDSIEAGNAWNTGAAHAAFFGRSLSMFVELFGHAQFPARFPGRTLSMMGMDSFAFLSLGLVIGEAAQFNRLAPLLIEANRRGYFYDKGLRPVFSFMLRLCAASLGAEDVPPDGDEAELSLLDLLRNWRSPDPNDIAEHCLAACDFHTRRCSVSRKHFHEFENGDWATLPIEILLLFKLRELAGLANPALVHPLTEGLRCALPTASPVSHDPLLAAVAGRMKRTGYADEIVYKLMRPT